MEPPPILRVEDHTTTPFITLHYTLGENDIDFPTVYKQIKSLLTHPSCTHRRTENTWPCSTCEYAFTTLYWSCATTLLDYFADFYATDSAVMQSVWFHLLDVWQECATHLPYDAVLDSLAEKQTLRGQIWGADSARKFEKDVRDTVELFEVTIWGKRARAGLVVEVGESVIYDPRGEAWCPVGEYETGPWVSGIKPWAQYLDAGGPGVAAPLPKGGGRFIPMPAIGIISTHTARARELATKLFSTQDPDNLTESLNTFEQHTITFPSSKGESATYTSPLSGQVLTYTLSNGAPPIIRKAGLGDPSMLVKHPDWNLLDECVGNCKGTGAYAPQSGEEDSEQEGEDDDMDDESEDSEDEVVFDMWTVVETDGEGGGKKKPEGLGEMFEEWCGLDEF
jgi:hypothetical protein